MRISAYRKLWLLLSWDFISMANLLGLLGELYGVPRKPSVGCYTFKLQIKHLERFLGSKSACLHKLVNSLIPQMSIHSFQLWCSLQITYFCFTVAVEGCQFQVIRIIMKFWHGNILKFPWRSSLFKQNVSFLDDLKSIWHLNCIIKTLILFIMLARLIKQYGYAFQFLLHSLYL